MIIDLPRFIEAERPLWTELEETLDRLENDANRRMTLREAERFHYLYQRLLSDLARIGTFSAEPEIRRYLESLTARAYGEIHETRDRALRFTPFRWFCAGFPRAFRRHAAFFWFACATLVVGAFFGAGTLAVDPDSKQALIPEQFGHLYRTPSQRVENEESAKEDRFGGTHAQFSTSLMANNIRVSVFMLGLGLSYGLGTLVLLFYNGVLLGAVAFDYVQARETIFLLGWLLPHGVIEIPAVLIAGQCGLLLGSALLGRGGRAPLRERLASVRGDLALLILGVALLLVWAGFIESFLSQFHAPVVPYSLKIAFGLVEAALLVWFLASAGRKPDAEKPS